MQFLSKKARVALVICLYLIVCSSSNCVAAPRRLAVDYDTILKLPENNGGPVALQLEEIGAANNVPIGLVYGKENGPCKLHLELKEASFTVAALLDQIKEKLPRYEATIVDGAIYIRPEFLPDSAAQLLDLTIPTFQTDSDTHQMQGMNLWVSVRGIIAPSEGSGIAGGNSTYDERLPAFTVQGKDVQSLLNLIASLGAGGIWIFQSELVKDLSTKTPMPFFVVGYTDQPVTQTTLECQ